MPQPARNLSPQRLQQGTHDDEQRAEAAPTCSEYLIVGRGDVVNVTTTSDGAGRYLQVPPWLA